MVALKVILTVLFLLVSVAMVVVVLFQEGKSAGLGSSISGGGETFWSKNKGRSVEGKLEKGTKWLAVAFFVFALVLNLF